MGTSGLQGLGTKTFFRARDAAELGVRSRALRSLVDEGAIERVARGLYRFTDAELTEHHTEAAVCARVPGAIVCLLSALSVHELGTQLPREVWIAIPHKARAPRVPDLPIKVVRFSGPSMRYGVEDVAFERVAARITSPARTVVDCFRFRRLVGKDVALEALRDALHERKASPDEIWRAAEACRAKSLVGPGSGGALRMTPAKEIRNIPASVRQRLLNLARNQEVRFNVVLQRYAAERFLYRLSVSSEVDRFVLKGAALFRIWDGKEARPTRDIDFLAIWSEDRASIRSALEAICGIPCPEDGVVFDPTTIRIADIREEHPYGGLRMRVQGKLGSIRLPLQVDIGVGDIITPEPEERDYPTLLDLPAPASLDLPARDFDRGEIRRDGAPGGEKHPREGSLGHRLPRAPLRVRRRDSPNRDRGDLPPATDVLCGRKAGGATSGALREHRAQPALAGAAATDRDGSRRSSPAHRRGRGVAEVLGAGLRQSDREETVHTGLVCRRTVAGGDSGSGGS